MDALNITGTHRGVLHREEVCEPAGADVFSCDGTTDGARTAADTNYLNDDAITTLNREASVKEDISVGPAAVAAAGEPQHEVLRADPWRYAVGAIFAFLSISNAMQWIAFSPIVDEVREFFHMNATQVNFLTTTYVIAYVTIVFLSCKLYEVTGIKSGLVIAAAANALGATVKIIALYAWPHAALLFIAQVINSITEVLTIATPPLIANRWFPTSERIVATTIMASALNFGCGIGVLIPTFFVGPNKKDRRHFGNFFWFHFAYGVLMLVLVVVFVPMRPRYAASFSAARQQSKEEKRLKTLNAVFRRRPNPSDDARSERSATSRVGETVLHRRHLSNVSAPVGTKPALSAVDADETTSSTFSEDEREVQPVNIFSVLLDCFREVRRNPSFVLLALGSAAELGLIWAAATVLPQMLAPYGISEGIAGWIGFLNLVLGTVVCPMCMPLVERFGRRYKLLLSVGAITLVVSMTLLTLLLHFGPDVKEDGTYYIVVAFVLWGGIAGLCQNFMMPLMFEYVVELTFPMAESTSAPVLTWAACLANFVLALTFGAVLTDDPDENKALRVFIASTVVAAIGALALLFTKPRFKRSDYEAHKLEERDHLLRSTAADVPADAAAELASPARSVDELRLGSEEVGLGKKD